MSIENNHGIVTGISVFNFAEKDDATGDIKGIFTVDTLFVGYIFKAEGRTSRNSLVFLRKGSDFQQGYGAIVT